MPVSFLRGCVILVSEGCKMFRYDFSHLPFVSMTGKVREGRNSLVVKVDNKRLAEGVPTLNSDWWNYGGLPLYHQRAGL